MQRLLRSTQSLCRRLGVASPPAFSRLNRRPPAPSHALRLAAVCPRSGDRMPTHRIMAVDIYIVILGMASSTANANGQKKRRKCKKKPPATILKNSTHRDGSIYKGNRGWKAEYCISNPAETRMEPMLMTDPEGCTPNRETCYIHRPCPMLHILSLKLARISSNGGPVQLYGYLAVRDYLDPLRNYVLNRSRNDPIIVEKGSLIEMTGPKRGIAISYPALVEYDLRIKSAGKEEDDQQLIDGVLSINGLSRKCCRRFTTRIDGACGTVDMSVGILPDAVEATVEVTISEVRSCLDLSISSYVSGLPEEFELFQGTIGEPCGLRRFVVCRIAGSLVALEILITAKGLWRSSRGRFIVNRAEIWVRYP